MDGMLLVTFFFPALVVFNFTLSTTTFLLTLMFSYGPELYRTLQDWVLGVLPHLEPNKNLEQAMFRQQSKQSMSLFWPLLVSSVTVWTTLTTYGFGGAARHGKSGWKFVQPGRGGVRYVALQVLTWVTFAASIAMPWTTLKTFGWFTLLGVVPDREEDPASLRGLLVVGSALGMLANTYCLIGLMVYNKSDSTTLRINWNLLGPSQWWWWLFLLLQFTMVFCSWQLAVMMEMQQQRSNNIVQCLLLCIVCTLLAVPLALTNAVAGKWKHGERKFRLSMPFQGGRVFALLQALGWTTFAIALASMLLKMYSIVTKREQDDQLQGEEEHVVKLSYTAFFGVLSFCFIAGSLFWFDPEQVDYPAVAATPPPPPMEEEEEEEGDDGPVHSVLGKRKGRSGGGLEYLVQWRADEPTTVWVAERDLLARDPLAIQRNNHLIQTPVSSSARKPQPNRARSQSPSKLLRKRQEDEEKDDDAEDDEEDVWEEVEDEAGNVFWYHEGKNLTRLSAPPLHVVAIGDEYVSEADEDSEEE